MSQGIVLASGIVATGVDLSSPGAIGGTTPAAITGTLMTATQEFVSTGENAVTAFATGGQASATALSATTQYHRVSVCATAGDSVKLPAATVGRAHYIRNDGAASCQVFGQATETIDGSASATGVLQLVGTGSWYICTVAGAWTSTRPWQVSATGHLITVDNIYDIGTSAATRPRSIYAATSVVGANTGAYFMISTDSIMYRPAANSFQYGGSASNAVAAATTRTEIQKAVTAFTDAVAKTVFTLTIPNAAHSASYMIRVTGSLGAGGAIGANEASATNCYVVTLTRTAGVAAVAAISAAFGAAACAVAGAATVTCVATLAAVSGAVGATNTIDVQATITRSGGASANHTCVATASLLNANATGITIA